MSDKTEDQIRKGLKLLAEDVQAPEGDGARRWFLPRISLRLGVVLAGAAICATVGALAATGAFSGGHKALSATGGTGSPGAKDRLRTGGPMIPAVPFIPPVWIVVNRANGTLSSVHVRFHSYSAHDSIQLRVVHSDPAGGHTVVYTTQVSTGDDVSSCPGGPTGTGPTGPSGPTGASGPRPYCFNMGSTWSGTLVPSDWNGGCQNSGDYRVRAGVFQSETFTCDGATVGPTGAPGPTGVVTPTGQ
jgi:hypothetical protein